MQKNIYKIVDFDYFLFCAIMYIRFERTHINSHVDETTKKSEGRDKYMREFLRGLELDKETIDTIMAEVGKQHTGLKEQVEEYKSKCSEYESQIKTLNSTIEENSKSLENLQTLTNENKDLKAEIQMNGSNVKKEFSKFVRNEVMSNVNDDTNFETALENYKKENPQYFGETVVTKVQTSPTLAGGQQPQTTNDVMNDFIRNN